MSPKFENYLLKKNIQLCGIFATLHANQKSYAIP